MKLQVLLRKIHNWSSIIIALPLIVIIGAGIFLQLKKEFEWIQPPTLKGEVREGVPQATLQDMFDAAKSVEKAQITTWEDMDRIDFKPDKGIIKFIPKSQWEVQVDTHTAEILSVTYRRSDVIEQIHDGSYFADWVKLWVFLPVGITLLVLWMTGVYMFFLPYYKKAQKKKKKA